MVPASAVILIFSGVNFVKSFYKKIKERKYFSNFEEDDMMIDMLTWIRSHTAKEACFLVSPFIQDFYLISQRAMFVSYKHTPQSERDIIEWYARLKLCNDGNDFDETGFLNQAAVERNFYTLSDDYLHQLMGRYDIDYYVGSSHRRLSLQKIYENKLYALYAAK